MIVNLDNAAFVRDPYFVGYATEVFSHAVYQRMVAEWPDEQLFVRMGEGYNKLSLSERFRPDVFWKIVRSSRVWGPFCEWVKGPAKDQVFRFLTANGLPVPAGEMYCRFEFSSIPADGGFIMPHRDIPCKVATLIFPIFAGEDGWQESWGGGTDVLRAKQPGLADYGAPLSSFDKATTCAYLPNACTLFFRSEDSWHSVGPLTGPKGRWRRSLTVNIQRVK